MINSANFMTGLEEASRSMSNTKVLINQTMDSMHRLMKIRSPEKYEEWFITMQKLQFGIKANFFCDHGRMRSWLLAALYSVFRIKDDVADRDILLPEGMGTPDDYLKRKTEFIRLADQPKDAVERILEYIFEQACKLGIDLRTGSVAITQSLEFDAHRYRRLLIPTDEEHCTYVQQRDGDGAARLWLEILSEDVAVLSKLKFIRDASRWHYDIRDLDEDLLQNGLVNIPASDVSSYSITLQDLQNPHSSAAMHRWKHAKSRSGLLLLDQHNLVVKDLDVKPITESILRKGYETPARKFFQNEIRWRVVEPD